MKVIYLILVFIYVLSSMIPLISNGFILLTIGIILVVISATFKSNFSAGKEYKIWGALFLIFVLISTIWSVRPVLTLYAALNNVLPILCLTYSLSRYINSYGKLINIFNIIYVGGVISLVYLYLFVDMTMLSGSRINAAMTDENLAEIWNVNSIGMNFALTILLGYIIANYYKNKYYWIIWTVISAAMLIAIMLTGSRKAILVLIIPFVVFALYDYKKHFLKAIILLLIAGGVIWMAFEIPFFYDIIGKRLEDMINVLSGNETGHEDNSRKELVELGLGWFKERPFLGYGMNCFRALSNTVPRFAGLNFYAHNNYVEILVGGGIVGFMVYYSYVILLLKRLKHRKSLFAKYAAVIVSIILVMDFAQVSYYDVLMQMLIVFAFILLRLKVQNKNIHIRK